MVVVKLLLSCKCNIVVHCAVLCLIVCIILHLIGHEVRIYLITVLRTLRHITMIILKLIYCHSYFKICLNVDRIILYLHLT